MARRDGPAFRFAHLSDPHLSDPSDVRLRQLAGKRLLGYLSWRRRRRHEHRPEMLATLGTDLHALAPDHTVVTGDLTHISLPQEFRQARAWLESLGAPDAVTVVPGNHDCYVRTGWAESLGQWAAFMRGDGDTHPRPEFPLLRVRGPVAFIGLSTAVPSAPLLATGRIGRAQLDALEQLLRGLQGRDLLRVLLLHHPPVPGEEKWRKRLVDAPQLCALLERHPVDLVLHGHRHRALRSVIRLPGTDIPVFGIPSASAVGVHSDYPSEYNEYEVVPENDCWRVTARARSWNAADGGFRAETLAELERPRPPRSPH
jgi:3',5'-cyclic AMP phosphodiesterase CpdA